jgi:FKBP-type peptidyl-prolyl cis-trans isomerase FklB
MISRAIRVCLFGIASLSTAPALLAAAATPSTPAAATVDTAPASAAPVDAHQASYTAGITFGAQLRSAGLNDVVALDALMDGIKAGLTGKQISPADQQRLMSWVRSARAELSVRNEAAGNEFLAKNSKLPGVVQTASGLQYKVLVAGDANAASPKMSDQVTVNYRGELLDGTEFDSSYKHGQSATFSVGQVIRGWSEALQLMKPGAKWELYLPASLAYGNSPPPGSGIGPGSTLHFQVELLKIQQPQVIGDAGNRGVSGAAPHAAAKTRPAVSAAAARSKAAAPASADGSAQGSSSN